MAKKIEIRVGGEANKIKDEDKKKWCIGKLSEDNFAIFVFKKGGNECKHKYK